MLVVFQSNASGSGVGTSQRRGFQLAYRVGQHDYSRNLLYSRGLHGNGDGGNLAASTGTGIDVAGILQDGDGSCGDPAGMEFVFTEPLGDALEILPTIKILVQALELWVTVNCHVKCPVWLLDM